MNKKGFTLIELLVVVAIIGILAAVGVVAYNGYTTSAKNAAIKSQFNMIVKYFTAELQKCNLGETKAMSDNLTCSGKTPTSVATAAAAALADFKNPYSTSNKAVTNSGNATADTDVGYTRVIAATGKVTITTCFATACSSADNRSSNDVTVE